MAVHHRGVSDQFTFSVAGAEHVTGIAVEAPSEVVAGEDFAVKIDVVCLTAGCELMGKNIQVKDEHFELKGEDTLTVRFFHVPSAKWGYRGYVTVMAPDEIGSYSWWGMFPAQSPHKASMARFNVVRSGEKLSSRGFPGGAEP